MTGLYPQRPWASPGTALIVLESNCWFSSTVIEPCQNRAHVCYSWWLTEGNPTNICSVTNPMKRLVAKHAWHPPVGECSDGPHSFTQRTFLLFWISFWEKGIIKKKSIFCSESSTASFHPSSCGAGTFFSFLWPLKKGKWRFMVFSTQNLSSIH